MISPKRRAKEIKYMLNKLLTQDPKFKEFADEVDEAVKRNLITHIPYSVTERRMKAYIRLENFHQHKMHDVIWALIGRYPKFGVVRTSEQWKIENTPVHMLGSVGFEYVYKF